MSRPKILLTRWIPDPGVELLKGSFDVEVAEQDGPLSRADLLARVGEFHGVIGQLTDRIDAEFFDAAKKLRGYANFAVGFDNIDVPEATRRSIPVSNTPDVLTMATAEVAWALLLGVARRVAEGDAAMRSGTWQGWAPLQFLGAGVSGKTLGIVGAGRIGTAMARLSRGFDMKIIYTTHSRTNEELEREMGAVRVDMDTMLAEADFISVHAPLNDSTRHLFDAASFAKMKKTAFIINTGRGPVIRETDLVEALKNGEIAGAGLDVYEFEPKMVQGLAECPNTVLLPHVGSATVTARNDMSLLAATNLKAMLEGATPPTCLNPEVL